MKDGTTLVDELKDKIHDQHDEIERLNNIIEEIREFLLHSHITVEEMEEVNKIIDQDSDDKE